MDGDRNKGIGAALPAYLANDLRKRRIEGPGTFPKLQHGIVHAVKAILSNSIVRAILQIAICAATFETGPGICAAAAGGLNAASGGTIQSALEAFAFTFIAAEVWSFEGDVTAGKTFALATGGGFSTSAATVLVHGVVGGALSLAQGSNFVQGFAAGSFGEIATQGTGQLGLGGSQISA